MTFGSLWRPHRNGHGGTELCNQMEEAVLQWIGWIPADHKPPKMTCEIECSLRRTSVFQWKKLALKWRLYCKDKYSANNRYFIPNFVLQLSPLSSFILLQCSGYISARTEAANQWNRLPCDMERSPLLEVCYIVVDLILNNEVGLDQ